MNKQTKASDKASQKIAYSMLRARVIPLVALFCAVVISSMWGHSVYLRYFGYGLTALSITYYFLIGLRYRFDKSIKTPSDNLVYFPMDGSLSEIKESAESLWLMINKSSIDSVAIRAPHRLCRWDGNQLVIDEIGMRISFDSGNLQRFDDEGFAPGNIIGMIVGKASYEVQMESEGGHAFEEGQKIVAAKSSLGILEYIPDITVAEESSAEDEPQD